MIKERIGSNNNAKALRALSAPERIDIIDYLKEENQTTLDELSDYMESIGYEDSSLSLVHQHLPLLEDYGVIETEEYLIKYCEDEFVEELIETVKTY